ncbi:MAG TPA: hypothetical protein VL422_12925 [Miltoncostaea sp.]|nr:hypothetical protein [Miltoncostaea sp.]
MAPHQTRRGRWPSLLAVLLVLLLAASAAAATRLPPPDAPPAPATTGDAQSPTEVTPSPDQPPAAPVTPATPATSAPAGAATTTAVTPADTAAAAAAAAREHARALRAAAQRRRIRANLTAIRDAALRGGQTLAGTRQATRIAAPVGAAAPPVSAGAEAVAAVDAPQPQNGPGQLMLLAALGGAALIFAIAAYPAPGRRGGTLERFRLEFAGVSVACVLVALMVLAGVV